MMTNNNSRYSAWIGPIQVPSLTPTKAVAAQWPYALRGRFCSHVRGGNGGSVIDRLPHGARPRTLRQCAAYVIRQLKPKAEGTHAIATAVSGCLRSVVLAGFEGVGHVELAVWSGREN